MTEYISRSKIKENCWVKRDEVAAFTDYKFGVDINELVRTGRLQEIVGKEGIDESFLSCGSCKDTWFSGTGGDNKYGRPKMCLNIYCPKGTQMTYAEPFNNYGQYGEHWDGVSKPTRFNENEVFMQRGTKFRVTKAEYDPKKDVIFLDVDVIGQNPRDFDVVWDDKLCGHGGRYGRTGAFKFVYKD